MEKLFADKHMKNTHSVKSIHVRSESKTVSYIINCKVYPIIRIR